MSTQDELIDHIRTLEKELHEAHERLEEFDDGYVHEDEVTDLAYERGMIHREDAYEYIDHDEYVDREDHRTLERMLEELSEAAENLLECEPDCQSCKDELSEAVSNARCYV